MSIVRFGRNFYSGSTSQHSLLELRRRGVSVILSVFPRSAIQSNNLKFFEKKFKFKVIYPPGKSLFGDSTYSEEKLLSVLASQALRLSKNHKVAVVCLNGDYSREVVAPAYLKLKKSALDALKLRARVKNARRKVRVRRSKKRFG